jgi:hypothetical protein
MTYQARALNGLINGDFDATAEAAVAGTRFSCAVGDVHLPA